MSFSKIPEGDYRFHPTNTPTEETRIFSTTFYAADSGKTAKRLARYINKSRHIFTSIMVSNHSKTLGNKVIDVLRSAAKPIRAHVVYHGALLYGG